ncbi:MAG: histidine kinase [Ignavibacteriae bacterium]|nr:histidine kinase [Ignavibacteriota bacterium]
MSTTTSENQTQPSSHQRTFWWLLSGVWLVLSIFMASQLVLRTAEGNYPVNWLNGLSLEILYCLQWIALSPITFWLARKFPLQSKKFFAGLLVHLVVGIVMSSLTMAGRTVLNTIFVYKFSIPLTLDHVLRNMTEALDYGVMSYLLNMLFSYSFVFYTQVREREIRAAQLETELGRAQLLALKMQLHPHFFFNTLNTISVLIRKQENDLAVEMIAKLSKFLRYTLDKTNIQEVTLEEELSAIDLYLEIQKVRFQEKLHIKRTISPDVLNAKVPTLILQPLVENALQHGISKREDGGTLELSAERLNGKIHITISDDGNGVQERFDQLKRRGIGLQNSESRLQKLYGSSFEFDINPNPGGGTTVHVAIPFCEEMK